VEPAPIQSTRGLIENLTVKVEGQVQERECGVRLSPDLSELDEVDIARATPRRVRDSSLRERTSVARAYRFLSRRPTANLFTTTSRAPSRQNFSDEREDVSFISQRSPAIPGTRTLKQQTSKTSMAVIFAHIIGGKYFYSRIKSKGI